jgi:outer membrane protein
MKKLSNVLVAGTLMAMAQIAAAQSPLSVNVGFINVDPDEDSGVEDDTTLGITFDYFINDNVAVELVAALPFEHDIPGYAASTKHLPPTLLAQYHFGTSSSPFRPFVGAGLNYTIFFSEEAGNLGNDLELDASFGLAWQLGFNYSVDPAWGVHFMASQIDIDSDMTVDGAAAGTAEIDPLVLLLGAKFNF